MTASFFRFRGFTLVELIIVITILSILSVISFVAFRGFMSDARDSSRLSDITNIKKGLDIYITQTSKYPSPENQNGTGVINGQILTYVGEFGENNSKMVNFNKAIKDPLTKTSYIYGTISNQTEYQLATIVEGNITAYKPLGETTYADVTQARVDGNYKGYIKFNSGSDLYIANIPSLIFSNTGSVELLQSNTYYIVNKKQNLPYDDKGNKNNFLLTQKITSDSLIKDITKNPTSTLTGVKITNLTKDNFETIFTGDTLKSFNVAGIDVSNSESLKLTVKTGILGGGGISIPKTYATCSLSGQTINHGSSITAYSENNIVWNASYDCTNRSEIKTCNDGVLSGSGIYQYISCIKGAVNNCSASGSYVYNTHTYSIPALNHGSGATNISSSNVSENNGTFKYTLSSISCNDGSLINPSESASKTLVSCNTNFHTEDNQTCISNTRTNQTCTGKPNNSVYNSATSITQTWNGTSWSPSTIAVWNTTTSTTDCRYTCNNGFTHQSGACNDITPPTGGSFTINGGATKTNTTSVTLNITCPTDVSSVQIAFGETVNPNSNWQACNTGNYSYTLSNGDGNKTVYTRFRDSASTPNVTVDFSQSISVNIPKVIYADSTHGTIGTGGGYALLGTSNQAILDGTCKIRYGNSSYMLSFTASNRALTNIQESGGYSCYCNYLCGTGSSNNNGNYYTPASYNASGYGQCSDGTLLCGRKSDGCIGANIVGYYLDTLTCY